MFGSSFWETAATQNWRYTQGISLTSLCQVLGWTRCSNWIQVGNWREVEGGGWECPAGKQITPSPRDIWLRGKKTHANARRLRLPQYIDRYARARHCTKANNCDTTILHHCKINKSPILAVTLHSFRQAMKTITNNIWQLMATSMPGALDSVP